MRGSKKILVTGCAGFIGSTLSEKLISLGYSVTGIDDFNDYYDPELKEKNIRALRQSSAFVLYQADILDFAQMASIFALQKPEKVVHLAARAGVRPSIVEPILYARVNVNGTLNLLKLAAESGVKQFIFCSSSSVYGNSKRIPFCEDDLCRDIMSPYGASKRAAEFFVESYHRTFSLPAVILRLFTVYGPRGRPDMAPAIFTKAILEGKEIAQFGDGKSRRDYTYVDDIIDGMVKTLSADLSFEIFNLGNNNPINLAEFIKTIEKLSKKKAKVVRRPIAAGDVFETWANIGRAKKMLSWRPKINVEEGMARYIKWLEKN